MVTMKLIFIVLMGMKEVQMVLIRSIIYRLSCQKRQPISISLPSVVRKIITTVRQVSWCRDVTKQMAHIQI